MENIELKAKTRTTTGNGPARVLRREGRIPAVLYGPNTEPLLIHISSYELDMITKKGNLGRNILNVVIDDEKTTRKAMVKEFQTHPVSHAFLHLDLYEVAMDRKIRVNVPVTVTGKAKGVEMGGMLQIIRRELEVLCLPDAIPNEITIDISDLDIGDVVHVEDIEIAGDVEIVHDVNFTVLTVVTTKAEEAEEEAEEEGEEAAAVDEEAGEQAEE